jgi:signal transduction histidine kinase
METLAPDAAAAGVLVVLHADTAVAMTADRGELEMIFNNLLSNAIKYNRPKGRVDVTLTKTDDRVTIAVADTGIGLTAEEAGRLFGEFVRIRNAKTQQILGSGLGLSIVKKIAQLYDGEATLKSKPDAGSTFTVVLQDQAAAVGR